LKIGNVARVALTVMVMGLHSVGHAGVCDYADRTYVKVTAGIAGASAATGAALKVAGVASVLHSSGAAIVSTASGGYVAGTLGAVGTAAGAITAPAMIAVGGAAAIAAAGTVAYCRHALDEDAQKEQVEPQRSGKES
jgi:hypothetical protein